MLKRLMVTTMLACAAFAAAAAGVTPNSGCGLPAVGYKADGTLWPADGKPAPATRMQVDDKGNWMICQPWVGDGEVARRADPPKPQPCKSDSVTWTIGDNTCSASLPGAASGFSSLATQEMGAMRGQATYVCGDGAWSMDKDRSHCGPAPACDLLQTIRYGSGENCSVTVDSGGRGRKPVGTTIAVPADAKAGWVGSAQLRCEFGGWQLVQSSCIQQVQR